MRPLDLPAEDRIRASRGPIRTSTWRGASNRQYGVSVYLPADCRPDDIACGVVIAVRRDGTGNSAGLAQAMRVTRCDDLDAAAAFLAGLPRACTEVHVHRSSPADERAAIAADLEP